MHPILARRSALRAALGLGAAAFLAPFARGHEFDALNLRINHPWCRATSAGATSAAIFMTFDQVSKPDRLVGVETSLASGAEMGGRRASAVIDFPIPAGADTVLGEDGTFIRLLGLKQPLELGRFYPLRLIFDQSGVVDAAVDVSYESLR